MVQIIILEIVGKDRGELYGTSQEVAFVVSPSEEWSIEMIMVQNFRVSFGEFLFANPAFVTVFKNSGASEVVRLSSFFIMKVTRQYFQHSNEFSHGVHSSMKWKKRRFRVSSFHNDKAKTAGLMFFNHGCARAGRIISHRLHLLQHRLQIKVNREWAIASSTDVFEAYAALVNIWHGNDCWFVPHAD